MAVRVSKPQFNLRDKLSELDRPVGNHGSQLMKSADAAESFNLIRAGRKNLIINGDMRINQRYGTNSSTEKDRITIDHWHQSNPGASNMTHQTVTDSPPGFEYSEKMTNGGSAYATGSGNTMFFQQNIEAYNCSHLQLGTSRAKNYTVSFWVKASIPGKYSIASGNTTSGGYTSGNTSRSFISSYYVNSSGVWEYKTVTFMGDHNGTWQRNNNTGGLSIIFDLGSGSNHENVEGQWDSNADYRVQNSVRLGPVASSYWMITGVQLEEGNVATPFEHRSYGDELALCQRYYYQTPTNHYHFLHKNAYYESQLFYFPVTMRASPTVTVPTPVLRTLNDTSNDSYSGLSISAFPDGFYLGSSTTNNSLFYTWIMTGAITASAEL
tara:strand:+ start:2831 stop:3973 length:1143 start_codon:yes stop_codon:yes gene_type:complete